MSSPLIVCSPDHRLKGWSKRRWSDFQETHPQQAVVVNGYIQQGYALRDITKSQRFIGVDLERTTYKGDPNGEHITWIEAKRLGFYELGTKRPKLVIGSRMSRIVNDGPLETYRRDLNRWK